MSTPRGRSVVRHTVAAMLAAATVGGVVLVSSPADADPLGDARARASALAASVDRLQTQAELATERYDKVEAALGVAVTERLLAERQVEIDQQAATAAATLVDDRARALYESGGRVSLMATVLDGSNPADFADRMHMVGALLGAGDSDVAAAQTVVSKSAETAQKLAAASSKVTALQQQAGAAATRVSTLLAEQQQALAAVSGEIRRLVAEQQAAAAAASARDFAAALAAAGGVPTGSTDAPNKLVATVLAAARSRLGAPYVWGATGPDSFDCSGLTQWAYAHAGIQLPRVAADQWNAGPHVTLADLQPGDLLFWATDVSNPATIHHVALYIGGGMMIAAPHTGDVVQVQPVYMDGYIGATRPYSTTA
ncbi:MAG TPA: NlpC/P60 family protein [Mycobacteriales bacterium]|nr:NlpC/P60 family protein [Mycobacteriales bacterium]